MGITYRANYEKFIDSLTPEQMMFLGSLIEKDIEAKMHDHVDKLADLMFQRISERDTEALQQKTLMMFSDMQIE